MKKLLLALVITRILISCDKKNDDPNDEPYLHFIQTTVSIPPFVAGSADLVVESNIDWKISVTSGGDWLQLNKSSGHGKDTIHVSVINENVGGQVRTATIMATVANPALNLQARITVEQKPYNVQQLSQKTIGGKLHDNISAMVHALDGGYLCVGLTNSDPASTSTNWGDAWMVKLNNNGDTLWTRIMDRSNFDIAKSAVATTDGGFIVAAETNNSNNTFVVPDWWIIKLKSNGDTAWTQLIRTANSEYVGNISATADGGFIVCGYSHDPSSPNQDVLIAKFNSSGKVVWQKQLGGSGNDFASAATVAVDGSIYIVAGTSSNNSGDVGANHGANDYWIIKLNADGDKIWSRVLGGNNSDYPLTTSSTPDGGCIVAGISYSSENGDVTGKNHSTESDIWVLKLNTNGDITWNSLLGGTGTDDASGIALTPDGGYVFAAYSNSSDGDVGSNQGSYDFWVFKLNRSGQKLWSKTFGGSGSEWSSDVLMNIDGSFWVAGRTDSNSGGIPPGNPLRDGWLVKFKDY